VRQESAAELERELEALRERFIVERRGGENFGSEKNEKNGTVVEPTESELQNVRTRDSEHGALEVEEKKRVTRGANDATNAVRAVDSISPRNARTPRTPRTMNDPDDDDDDPESASASASAFVSPEEWRQRLDAATRRAERAERALETAHLLARPRVTESDAEFAKLIDSGRRALEIETSLETLKRELRAAESSLGEAASRASAAESDARIALERARRAMEEKDAELDALRTRMASFRDSSVSEFEARLAHVKNATLKYLEAADWDEQSKIVPVLAAVQRWDPSERRRVEKARAAWEPAEVVVLERLRELRAVDLGVASATNALTSSLGLGNVF
jgi:hypothetical protein